MDVSWIPGDSDALVVVAVATLAVAGLVFARLRRRARKPQVDARERVKQAPKPIPKAPQAKKPQAASAGPEPKSAPKARTEAKAPAASAPRKPPAAKPPAPAVAVPEVEMPEARQSRFARLRSRISGAMGGKLLAVFSREVLTQDDWDELEETLLIADVGPTATDDLLTDLRARMKADSAADPREVLRAALLEVLEPGLDRGLNLGDPGDGKLATAIVVGVNGVGKTTTVGKLARVLRADGHSVLLGAADTFRAAAADQLETWGARVGVETVRSDREGADPASVAFEAAQRAVDTGASVLLVDTAGRLQNKQGLMDELGKIVRVVTKVREPSEVLLVLDATTGQNGVAQAKVFGEVAALTGIVLTKMDGTAKGGIVIAVQRELGVPVKFIGLGEGADDLAPFEPAQFVDGLLGG